jgi:enoyl-CoA hydratase
MSYQTILYATDGPIATITLNRPAELNTIVLPMPDEVEDAVNTAVRDQAVKVMILRGAGRAFCAGYNFGGGFRYSELLSTDGRWDPGKDMMHTTAAATSPHHKFMSIWRSPKPVIAQVHGWCVGGGSDYALCADLVIASEDAQIGTPYSRVWGAYLSGMWIYRLGLTRAKYYALTGKPLSGREAADIGTQAEDLASLPMGQLAAQKLMVNQAYENMGLASTQTLGAVLDGIMRNIPEAHAFIDHAAEHGVSSAVAERDGRFADYSQAPDAGKPDPAHIIEP